MQSVLLQKINRKVGVALSVRNLRLRRIHLDSVAVGAGRMTQVDQEVGVGNRPAEVVEEEGNCCLVEVGILVQGGIGQVGRVDDLPRMEAYWTRMTVG